MADAAMQLDDVPATPAIEIDNVSVTFGQGQNQVRAIDRISLDVRDGEFLTLIGHSGCGKSTLLKIMAGLVPPTTGRVVLDGRPVLGPRPDIGMMFQQATLLPWKTTIENIVLPIEIREGRGAAKAARARAMDLLELVGLGDFADVYPGELSGGMAQRASICRMLVADPAMLLLDEPFSNLDADLRRRLSLDVREILKTLGISAILVTHDQQEAFAMCDQVAVLKDGGIQQWDVPYNLYHEPANRFVAGFVGQGGFVPGKALGPDTIESELGVIRGNRAYTWQPGTLVDVLIRPDDIVYDANSELKPKVVEKTFAGTSTLYRFRCSEDTEFEALFRSHLDFNLGEHVPVRVEADHLIAFERTT